MICKNTGKIGDGEECGKLCNRIIEKKRSILRKMITFVFNKKNKSR